MLNELLLSSMLSFNKEKYPDHTAANITGEQLKVQPDQGSQQTCI